MKIAAIIPAYNEQHAIAGVVEDIHRAAKKNGIEIGVIVVNDCSTDRTFEIISNLDCIALDLPINLGIGGAVQTGFKYAFENGYDYAVQVDGDGQHPADAIPLLLNAMMERGLDVVIGSRFIDKTGFQSSSARRAGINWFRWLNRMLTGVDIRDTTSGFRMLNRRALEVVSDYYPDDYPEPEALVLYSKKKLKIGETAVEMRERQGGTSSIGSGAAIFYMWKVTLGVFFTFIRPNQKIT
jgi:glycosyltransferase involved in cell wall biosynthesis